jgi:hypothetical protein
VGDLVTLTPEEPAQTIDFSEVADLSDLPGGGVEAVLRMTPFDAAGNQGWPAFKTVNILWLDDDEDGLPNQWEELYEGFDPNEDNSDILAKFETAASGTGIFANLVQDTIDTVVAMPNEYNLFTETQVETAAQAARTFINVSARVGVGGEEVVIPGFTIVGSTKKIIIRAVGPKLADFGLENPLADPIFWIYQARFDGQPADLLANIDDWTVDGGDVDAIKAAVESTGAFPLDPVEDFQGAPRPTDDTKSPATILELGSGVYIVVVKSVDGSFGEVLIEAYEIEEEGE